MLVVSTNMKRTVPRNLTIPVQVHIEGSHAMGKIRGNQQQTECLYFPPFTDQRKGRSLKRLSRDSETLSGLERRLFWLFLQIYCK